jgi:hypothetical protein
MHYCTRSSSFFIAAAQLRVTHRCRAESRTRDLPCGRQERWSISDVTHRICASYCKEWQPCTCTLTHTNALPSHPPSSLPPTSRFRQLTYSQSYILLISVIWQIKAFGGVPYFLVICVIERLCRYLYQVPGYCFPKTIIDNWYRSFLVLFSLLMCLLTESALLYVWRTSPFSS